MKNKIGEEAFRDPEEAERIRKSPISSPLDAIRLSTADECMKACETLDVSNFQLPVLIIHGDADTVIPLETSKALLEALPIKDKKLVVIDDGRHCLAGEPEEIRMVVSTALEEWIDGQLSQIVN